MRSIFGWSYPPGCNGTPYDEDMPCEICGEYEDHCICPECPKCGSWGDPACYLEHGMKRSDEQKFNLEIIQRAYADYCEQENKFWEQELKDREKDPWY